MRYLLYIESGIAKEVAEPLSAELTRFDVRAEISTQSSSKVARKLIRSDAFDIVIAIGSSLPKSLLSRKSGACFIWLSSLGSKLKVSSNVERLDLFFPDVSYDTSAVFYGSPILDVVRRKRSDVSSIEDRGSSHLQLGVIHTAKRRNLAENVAKALERQDKSLRVETAQLDTNLEQSISCLLNSNAAIVTDNPGEVIAIELNCPVIRVNPKTLFFQKDSTSMINRILKKEAIKVFAPMEFGAVWRELQKVLNDHNYCAGIMADYQLVKELLGIQPAIRNIARAIVERFEES